jgi:hypothetical protein
VDVPEYDYGISLRPIPATTALFISLDNFGGPLLTRSLVSLGNVRLQVLKESQEVIDLSGYASGLYLLRLERRSNDEIFKGIKGCGASTGKFDLGG